MDKVVSNLGSMDIVHIGEDICVTLQMIGQQLVSSCRHANTFCTFIQCPLEHFKAVALNVWLSPGPGPVL